MSEFIERILALPNNSCVSAVAILILNVADNYVMATRVKLNDNNYIVY